MAARSTPLQLINALRPQPRHRGFALITTLSLMTLLLVLATGLLSLSAVEMRTSSQGSPMAQAQANARLALMMAIGQLQKDAGPDQRVTARADIRQNGNNAPVNARLTGVWKAQELDPKRAPEASDFSAASRSSHFQGWLASSADEDAARQISFPEKAPESPVTLWGAGTLGHSMKTEDTVQAGRVTVNHPKSPGAYAWAVLDEGVKARINTPFPKSGNSLGERTAELGTGTRPGTDFITGLESLERNWFEDGSAQFVKISRGITPQTLQLAFKETASDVKLVETLKGLTHDITPWSVGLFTDTSRGGLKQDFSLLTNDSTLPSEYDRKGVYASLLNLPSNTATSDPNWNALFDFSALYRNKIINDGGVPVVKATAPANWKAATGGEFKNNRSTPVVVSLAQPEGLILMPVLDKVQMLFSLIGRDYYNYPRGGPITTATNFHGPQDDWFRGSAYTFGLDLLYTPIVTLHNPYNVALEFVELKIEFSHVPFAAQIVRNGIPQSRGLAPLDQMHGDSKDGNTSQGFSMTLKTGVGSSGSPGTSTFRLLPGETKLFSPYINPVRTWDQEIRGDGGRLFWDVDIQGNGSTTRNLQATPGYRHGVGFDLDYWNPPSLQLPASAAAGRWDGCIGLAPSDQVRVNFAPRSLPLLSSNKFTVKMSARPDGGSAVVAVSAIEIDYQKPNGLEQSLLPSMRRADPDAKFPLSFPKTTSSSVTAMDLLDHRLTPLRNIKGMRPFALLSVQAKTTMGGIGDREDGRWATKPWAFSHATAGVSTGKLASANAADHGANQGYEFDLQVLPLSSGVPSQLQLSTTNRTNSISGRTAENGVKFGIKYDVPLTPLQSLATLNGANPAGAASGPRFAQPIGNSWAHPLLPPGEIINGASLDHSFLLNLALYDRFYFSGLASQTGPFASGRDTENLAESFASGEPLDDPRLRFLIPTGSTAGEFVAKIGDDDGYQKVAAWQVMEGAFNINSTSVNAWKAMLTSIHNSNGAMNRVDLGGTKTAIASLSELETSGSNKEVRISRFRLPTSESAEDASGALGETYYWMGAREYSQKEIQTLAENIVEQVRKRGPFLSMADFVNRRVGSGEEAQRGALQQAIDDSDLNESLAIDNRAGYDIALSEISDYGYLNPEAGAGPSYQGAPGFLTQADLLTVLGNAATPRSDTFTVRGYGEARDASGRILATAVCEAVVQRLPEWVDPADAPDVAPALLTSTANKTFGRRFQTVSFRWIHPDEI